MTRQNVIDAISVLKQSEEQHEALMIDLFSRMGGDYQKHVLMLNGNIYPEADFENLPPSIKTCHFLPNDMLGIFVNRELLNPFRYFENRELKIKE